MQSAYSPIDWGQVKTLRSFDRKTAWGSFVRASEAGARTAAAGPAGTIARDLGFDPQVRHTVDFDRMMRYRPTQHVLTCPVPLGRGERIVAQHAIVLPAVREAILERIGRYGGQGRLS